MSNDPLGIDIGCLLDDDYLAIQSHIYDSLGNPSSPNIAVQLKGAITKDIGHTGKGALTTAKGLTTEQLGEVETQLAVDAQNTSYLPTEYDPSSHDEGGGTCMEGADDDMDIIFPQISKRLGHANTDPRGRRTPLYDAIELYLTRIQQSDDHTYPTERTLNNITTTLTHIRDAIYHYYETILLDPMTKNDDTFFRGAINQVDIKTNQMMRDGLLNVVNISQEERAETIIQLLNRFLGQEEVKQYFDTNDSIFETNSDKKFLHKLHINRSNRQL